MPASSPISEPMIVVFWHNRQILMPSVYLRLKEQGLQKPLAVLSSQHGDGLFAVKIIKKFGLLTVLGSSTRGGKRALLQLTRALSAGGNVAITPDGPRGPIFRCKEGAIKLAQLSGRPIYPLAFSAKWKIRLKSWDRLIIPLPFTRVLSLVGEPIWIPRELNSEQFEAARASVDVALQKLTESADKEFE